MLATKKHLFGSGWQNYLRQVPPGVTFYYPGLEGGGATVKDYAGYGNDGAITGAVWRRLPSGLWCLDFATDDRVSAALSASLKMADGDFTMSLWFNAPAQLNTVQGLMHGGGGGGGGKRYSMYCDDSDVNPDSLQIQLDDNANPCFVVVPYTGWGTWTLLHGVRDGNTFRSYLNGVASTTGDCTATGSVDSPAPRPLDFGAESNEADGAYYSYLTGSLTLGKVRKGVAISAAQAKAEWGWERQLVGV